MKHFGVVLGVVLFHLNENLYELTRVGTGILIFVVVVSNRCFLSFSAERSRV